MQRSKFVMWARAARGDEVLEGGFGLELDKKPLDEWGPAPENESAENPGVCNVYEV